MMIIIEEIKGTSSGGYALAKPDQGKNPSLQFMDSNSIGIDNEFIWKLRDFGLL
jgi:hypothetical protein